MIWRSLRPAEGTDTVYERFTDRARKVMQLANQEAWRFSHEYIGTEHILLGLVKEGSGVGANVLKNLEVDLRKVRLEVEKLVKSGPDMVTMGKLPQTPRAKKVIEYAIEEARNLNHNYVGTEHLLLGRRTKNSPVLLGEAGVGKTAIVEGLAQKIIAKDVPEILADRRIVVLDLAMMVAGTKYRGQFEERIKAVMNEVRRAKNVLLFIDELHTLVGAGGAEGAIDASNVLKPALSRGEIQCIGATTFDEYRKYIEKDQALARRFQSVIVNPPAMAETIAILKGLRDRYEAHHRVQILDAALDAAVEMSDRYITGRCLPDKAIDVLDEAGGRGSVGSVAQPPEPGGIGEANEAMENSEEGAVEEA